jgi:hypothetical protein
MSLTGSCFSSDSAPRPFHNESSKTRWNNLLGDLAASVTAGSSGSANSPHPSSREGHHSTVGWISGFLLFDLILYGSHAATTSLVHRNSAPSTHMRCMTTANRRARATIAFFIPRRLTICIAQSLSQDHFFDRSMLCFVEHDPHHLISAPRRVISSDSYEMRWSSNKAHSGKSASEARPSRQQGGRS